MERSLPLEACASALVLVGALLGALILSAWRALKEDVVDYSDSSDRALNPFADVDPVVHYPWIDHRGNFNVKDLPDEAQWLETDRLTRAQTLLAQRYLLCPPSLGGRQGAVFRVCVGYEDKVREASLELLDAIVGHFSLYHSDRKVVSRDGDAITNHITGSVYSLQTTHPLVVCRLVSGEDCVIMLKDRSDPARHILAGAVICFPDDWLLEEKIGLPLSAIHYPVRSMNTAGESSESHSVPAASPMLRIMERFFDDMYTSKKIFKRFNYTFQSHECHTNRFDGWLSWLAVQAIDLLSTRTSLRTERQTLRLLRASGAVAFLVRTKVTPLGAAIRSRAQAVELAAALGQLHAGENSGKGRYRRRALRFLSRTFDLAGGLDGKEKGE